VNALAGNGVEVLANPVDTSGLLAAGDFVVLPITIGGGTRIKAIEAMAWGIPVIASTRAVEGLGLVDRVSVRFAETPSHYCEAIGSLWSDPVAYRAQRDAARQHALARFGPEAIAKAVCASFVGTAA
jgi:glycosyltransferase involved in cell wall biosynthesis